MATVGLPVVALPAEQQAARVRDSGGANTGPKRGLEAQFPGVGSERALRVYPRFPPRLIQRPSKGRTAWGMPPTYDEWMRIQQQGKTEFPEEEAAEGRSGKGGRR